MTNKKVFIHVGAGKTGTSALQSFFFLNRELLHNKGVTLPSVGQQKGKDLVAHHQLSAHRVSTEEQALAQWGAISEMPDETVLITSEFLHSKMSAGGGRIFFEKVRDLLCDREVYIIFYIRRHSQWLQSAYAQWVKGERESRTFEEFSRKYPKNAPDQILEFAQVFSPERVLVRPYERQSFFGGDIFRDFVSLLGLEWDADFVTPTDNVNPRLSIDALELKRRANIYSKGPFPDGYLSDLLSYSRLTDQASGDTFHSHVIMPPAVQIEIERKMEGKYKRVAREIMRRDDGRLFQDDLRVAESDREGMEASDLSDILIYQNLRIYQRLSEMERELERVRAQLQRY